MHSFSVRAHSRRVLVFGGAVVVVLALVAVLPLGAGPSPQAPAPDPREIVLVARNMAFRLADGSPANPVIRLRAGERVRLVLRNEDPGVTHDLAVKALDVALAPFAEPGQRAIEFTVPARPGRHEYVCTPHAQMMRGTLEIADSGLRSAD